MKTLKFTLLALVVAIAACSNESNEDDTPLVLKTKTLYWECEGLDIDSVADPKISVPATGGEYSLYCKNSIPSVSSFSVNLKDTVSKGDSYGYYKFKDGETDVICPFLFGENDTTICKWFTIKGEMGNFIVKMDENDGNPRAVRVRFGDGPASSLISFIQAGKK